MTLNSLLVGYLTAVEYEVCALWVELKFFIYSLSITDYCRSTPARHAANPFHKERHPNAQGETQTLTRLLTNYF